MTRGLLLIVATLGPCAAKNETPPVDRSEAPTTATTPPIYQAPDTASATPSAAPSARAVDPRKVKLALEKKVRAGRATPDEAQQVLDACTVLRDKSCTDAVHQKYPDLTPR